MLKKTTRKMTLEGKLENIDRGDLITLKNKQGISLTGYVCKYNDKKIDLWDIDPIPIEIWGRSRARAFKDYFIPRGLKLFSSSKKHKLKDFDSFEIHPNPQKEYYLNWMKNLSSKQDIPRIKHLVPYLKKCMQETKNRTSILDIGCGWGEIIPYLDKLQKYTGIDSNKYFLLNMLESCRKLSFDKNIKLQNSNFLDANIDSQFDYIFCSMFLHHIPNLSENIDKMFEYLKTDGRMNIITFSDSSTSKLERSFSKITNKTDDLISGNFILPSGIELKNETIHLHKEIKIEHLLREQEKRRIQQEYLGDLFVTYKVS